MDEINASYAIGGRSLLIQTAEQLTEVRIDHYLGNFGGLIEVTDDLGGVEVVGETTSNGPYTFPAGVNYLDGQQARWYLGQRYGLERGGFDRVKRQQQYLRAMFEKLFSSNTFTDRHDSTRVLAVTGAVSIDGSLEQRRPAVIGLLAARRHTRQHRPLHHSVRWARAWRARPAWSASTPS